MGILHFFDLTYVLRRIAPYIHIHIHTHVHMHALRGRPENWELYVFTELSRKLGAILHLQFGNAVCQCSFGFAVLRCSFTIAVLHSIRSFPEFREQKQSSVLQCSFAFSDRRCSFQFTEANAVLHFLEQFSNSNLQTTMLQKQLQEDKFRQQFRRQLVEGPLHVASYFSKFF